MRRPDELRTIMRTQRHLAPVRHDAFSIDSSATFQNLLGKVINNFGAVVAAIATISLVIGGIVIMNIMLVASPSAPARSACAKRWSAAGTTSCMQFLIESATLALAGGLIGVIAGIVSPSSLPWPFPSLRRATLVHPGRLFVSASVGLFFGIYPAYKASALDPIAALRAEL